MTIRVKRPSLSKIRNIHLHLAQPNFPDGIFGLDAFIHDLDQTAALNERPRRFFSLSIKEAWKHKISFLYLFIFAITLACSSIILLSGLAFALLSSTVVAMVWVILRFNEFANLVAMHSLDEQPEETMSDTMLAHSNQTLFLQ